jgi:pyruvate dehydrogenase E1 component alpha subunit
VFVCQNNGYGEHTRYEVATSGERISDRAAGYGMPGVTVDGNNPLAVYAAANEAVQRAREGGGPTLIEAKTFRFYGHVFGDADSYMRPGEKEAAMAQDPLPRYRAWLIESGVAESTLADIEKAIDREVFEAAEFALSSPWPDPGELARDVLAEEVCA